MRSLCTRILFFSKCIRWKTPSGSPMCNRLWIWINVKRIFTSLWLTEGNKRTLPWEWREWPIMDSINPGTQITLFTLLYRAINSIQKLSWIMGAELMWVFIREIDKQRIWEQRRTDWALIRSFKVPRKRTHNLYWRISCRKSWVSNQRDFKGFLSSLKKSWELRKEWVFCYKTRSLFLSVFRTCFLKESNQLWISMKVKGFSWSFSNPLNSL